VARSTSPNKIPTKALRRRRRAVQKKKKQQALS
jgi:hypothetical protein